MISRRQFLKMMVGAPFAAAAMPALAWIAPNTVQAPPDIIAAHDPTGLKGEIWWFAAKRSVIVNVKGTAPFTLETDEACCFVHNGERWVRIGMPVKTGLNLDPVVHADEEERLEIEEAHAQALRERQAR